jgi:hypothetical protein
MDLLSTPSIAATYRDGHDPSGRLGYEPVPNNRWIAAEHRHIATHGISSRPMQITGPEPPEGQQYLLRGYLRRLFTRAQFEGDAWASCVAAFLDTPGVPLLAQNATTQAPASFFHKLFQPRDATDPVFQRSEWTGLLAQLEALGDRRVAQLIITDASFSWVLFLSENLDEVLAFGGRPLPGASRFERAADFADLRDAKFVREVFRCDQAMRLTEFNRDRLDVTVVLADETGATFSIKFEHALSVQMPTPKNESIRRVIEVTVTSGRPWFVFQPSEPNDQRALAIQASSVRVQTSDD